MTHISTTNPALEIALGKRTGRRKINKFGRALDCDRDEPTDIWDGADGATATKLWIAPAAPRIHDIVSASADDDGEPLGTGMRTIRIFGLVDWDTAEVSEDLTLQGTTPIQTENNYVIIHRMLGLTFGALGTNAGVITATAQTDATVTAAIHAGQGQTLMVIYGIPSAQTLQLMYLRADVAMKSGGDDGGVTVDATLLVKEYPGRADAGFLTKERFQFTNVAPLARPYAAPNSFVGPAIAKFQAVSSMSSVDITAAFDAFVVDN
jgi:hypothetical protein